MGRGFGRKADRTGRCKCDNHRWDVFEVRETQRGEVVVSFHCTSCGALWDTKSKDARKHINMSSRISVDKDSLTYGEFFERADAHRRTLLEGTVKALEGQITEIEKEIAKYKKEMQSLDG
ncbi:MAG: hypothetical protein NC489_40845 [Ruminococcus flavefaciens]|nr:hypothetical protein [Ruminococcus flavefaciens]